MSSSDDTKCHKVRNENQPMSMYATWNPSSSEISSSIWMLSVFGMLSGVLLRRDIFSPVDCRKLSTYTRDGGLWGPQGSKHEHIWSDLNPDPAAHFVFVSGSTSDLMVTHSAMIQFQISIYESRWHVKFYLRVFLQLQALLFFRGWFFFLLHEGHNKTALGTFYLGSNAYFCYLNVQILLGVGFALVPCPDF